MSPFQPEKCVGDGLYGGSLRQIRALDYDDGERQRPRRVELGGGSRTARVLGDDYFDLVRLQQRALVFEVERPARGDQLRARRQLLGRARSSPMPSW